MKPAKCPFYPDSCTVEFHPNMQHVWRANVDVMHEIVHASVNKALNDAFDANLYTALVTNAPKITNKASERARAWNKANRKQYNARQKLLMAGKRGKRGS